jgi:hypothetical protein
VFRLWLPACLRWWFLVYCRISHHDVWWLTLANIWANNSSPHLLLFCSSCLLMNVASLSYDLIHTDIPPIVSRLLPPIMDKSILFAMSLNSVVQTAFMADQIRSPQVPSIITL